MLFPYAHFTCVKHKLSDRKPGERYDLKDINKNIPMKARERAYSSPI